MLNKFAIDPNATVNMFVPDPDSEMEWRTFKFTAQEITNITEEERLEKGQKGAWFRINFPGN